MTGTKSFTVTQAGTFNPKLVGSLAGIGVPTDIVVNAGRAFISSTTFGLSIADVTNPGSVSVLGRSDIPFSGSRVAVGASRAIVAGSLNGLAHLWVLDVSVPSAPRVVGEVSSTLAAAWFYDVALNDAGTRAVIAMASGGVLVVDLTNPAAPTTAPLDTAGTAYRVALNAAGTVAYVADGAGGLKVLSLANPAAPTQVGSLPLSGIMRDVALAGTVAYLADQMGRVVSVDVTTASAPAQLGAVVMGRYTFDLAVEGTRVVVRTADTADYLNVVDVSNPANPVLGGSLAMNAAGDTQGLALRGGRAYVASSSTGLKIYDMTPAVVGGFADDFVATHVASAGTRAVITGTYRPTGTARLRIVDASVPSAPHVVGEVPSTMVATAFLDVAINAAGTRAVIAVGGSGVIVVDLANPAAPTTATFDTAGTAYGVALNAAGTLAYVADGLGGLKVLSLANLAAPTQVGSFPSSGIMRDVAVAGPVVYLADQMGRVVTVDVTTASAPVQLGALSMGRYTFNVAVEGTRAVVLSADSIHYLDVLDVSNPANPVLLGTGAQIDAAGQAKGVALTGGHAFVADSTHGLKIYDIANPSGPSLVGMGYTVGEAVDVAVTGSTVWAADGAATISVIDLLAP